MFVVSGMGTARFTIGTGNAPNFQSICHGALGCGKPHVATVTRRLRPTSRPRFVHEREARSKGCHLSDARRPWHSRHLIPDFREDKTLQFWPLRFWRKRNEGFEWHDYVRTTILLRRQDRRKKVEDVKAAAMEQVKESGRQGLDLAASGIGAVVQRLSTALRWTGGHLWQALAFAGTTLTTALSLAGGTAAGAVSAVGRRLGPAAARGASGLRTLIQPLADVLGRPALARAFAMAAALATLVAGVRLVRFGVDRDTVILGAVAVTALALFLIGRLSTAEDQAGTAGTAREAMRQAGERLRALPGLGLLSPLPAALVAGAIGLGIVVTPLLWRGVPASSERSMAAASGGRSEIPVETTGAIWVPANKAETVEGRASALSGSLISLGGRKIRLAGIEAPDLDQTCSKPGNKRWRCGESAREGLARLLSSRRISCELTGKSSADIEEGRCHSGDDDIAAQLVKLGHVFAESGMFATYRSLERDAEDQQVGLWSSDAERPTSWRARLWEEAKQAAPGGCPIKGKISFGNKRYLLPWSSTYADATIREQRGERWFCSEDEAQAAGWKPRDKS